MTGHMTVRVAFVYSAGVSRWAAVLITLAAFAWLAAACSTTELSLEDRARALDRQLICPICPGSTIDQSSVQISKDMRRIVREKLGAGESEQQIKDYFVERYGPFVLAAPPQTGFNILAWVIPGVALTAGAVGVAMILRAMRSRQRDRHVDGDTGSVSVDASGAELDTYLRAVDADLEGILDRNRPERGDG